MSFYWNCLSKIGRWAEDRSFSERITKTVDSTTSGPVISFHNFLQDSRVQTKGALPIFEKYIRSTIQEEGRIKSLSNSGSVGGLGPQDRVRVVSQGEDKPIIEQLALNEDWNSAQFICEGIKIGTVVPTANTIAIFRDCEIGTIRLAALHPSPVLNLQRCKIHKVEFWERCCGSIVFEDCVILSLSCPKPGTENPITGFCRFSNSRFSLDPALMSETQEYRNLRHHLLELHDLHSAGVVQRPVLVGERREGKSRIYKLSSYLYQLLSDFGNSPTRPVVAWLVGVLASLLVIYASDGAAVTLDSAVTIEDWRSSLRSTDVTGDFWRSLILALDAWAGPLGILYDHDLVQSRNWMIGSLVVFGRLFATLLQTLLILALRRSFRMA